MYCINANQSFIFIFEWLFRKSFIGEYNEDRFEEKQKARSKAKDESTLEANEDLKTSRNDYFKNYPVFKGTKDVIYLLSLVCPMHNDTL